MHSLETSHPAYSKLAIISSCLDASADLVAQLLNYAKGSPSSEMGEIDLLKLISDILQLLPFEKSNKKFILDFPEDPLLVTADRSQMTQLFMNLIFNAVEAMRDEGTISISGRRYTLTENDRQKFVISSSKLGDECVLIKVKDTGVGMNDETVAKVFDPYFTTKEEGKGLGMAMVVGTVRRHGGAIYLESEENKGSCFHIVLPEVETNTRPKKNTQAERKVIKPALSRVLVVDDEPILRQTIKAILKMGGTEVVAADGLSSALEAMAEGERFDCALIDITMPEASGWEVKAKLMKLQPDLACLMMSGYSISPEEAGFPDLEGTVILDKPFHRAELLEAIGNVVGEL